MYEQHCYNVQVKGAEHRNRSYNDGRRKLEKAKKNYQQNKTDYGRKAEK